jgi:hypothetical protein
MTRGIARVLMAMVVLVGILSGSASANETTAPALIATDPETEGFAVGGGKTDGAFPLLIEVFPTSFNLSAQERLEGDDFGHVGMVIQTSTENIHVRVDVDCVNVHGPGRRAVLTGIVTKVSPEPNSLEIEVGKRRDTYVDDEGQPSSGPVDGFLNLAGTEGSKSSCEANGLFNVTELDNVTQGNITIKSR